MPKNEPSRSKRRVLIPGNYLAARPKTDPTTGNVELFFRATEQDWQPIHEMLTKMGLRFPFSESCIDSIDDALTDQMMSEAAHVGRCLMKNKER